MKMISQEKKLIRFLVLVLIALLIAIPISWQKTFAASSSVSISDGEPNVGDSFTVTIYYSGDSFGSADGALTYDASILRYESSSAQQANGSNGEIAFSHYQTSGENSMAISFFFTVIGSGTSTVTAVSSDIYNADGNSLGGDSASTSFTVAGSSSQTPSETPSNETENSEQSSNANLTSLSIACGELTPAFSPDITEYSVVTSPAETNVGVWFDLADQNANWAITGTPEFTENEVTRVITITAPDGTQKVYSIKITRGTPTGDIIYNGVTYNPSQNQNISEVPASFIASKMDYNGRDLSVLKSRDGNVNLIRLIPEGGSDSDGSWFVYNADTKTFVPSEIITIDGNKYVVVKGNVNIVYGGSESASGYQVYDPATGTISSIKIDGSSQAPTEAEETPSETEPEETAPSEEEPTPAAEASSSKKSKGLLWFILLIVLALILALLYLMFRDKFGKNRRSTYAAFDDDDDQTDEDSSLGNKFMLTLAGLKGNVSSKLSNKNADEDTFDEESGMSERRIERRRRIAEAEAKAAAGANTTEAAYDAGATIGAAAVENATVNTEPISEGSVVTKAELEAAKLAAAEKAREEAERAAAEAKAAQEAAAAALAARDAARAAKARVASSELDSAMEELLEVGEELNEAVNKKNE